MGIWFKKSDTQAAAYASSHVASVPALDAFDAHDVRNVVTSLSLLADQLTTSPDPRARQVAGQIGRASDRLIEMTSRSGPIRNSAAETVSIRQIFRDIEDVVSHSATRNVELFFHSDDEICLDDEAPHIFRILCNLALNAVTAMNRAGSGELHVFTCSERYHTDIFVLDTGPGLFSKPLRADLSKFETDGVRRRHRPEGSGLGLLIALQLAAKIEAELDVLSTDASGSCFRLRLPSHHETPSLA